MKVVVIGATGQLGRDVEDAFGRNGDTVVGLSHGDIEISDIDSVSTALRQLQPELIVNTAAFHQVERCEQEPATAFAVNGLGARNLAIIAQDLGAGIVQFSTDYIFDGYKHNPYEERDAPRPLNVYGNTKLAGEYFVRSACTRHFVLRTSALYGKHPCRGKGGRNFIELMLMLGKQRGRVQVINSEEVTPTSTLELAQQVVILSRCDNYGVFHASAEKSCTWYDYAREIFSFTGISARVDVADPRDFPSKAARPSYSVLENRALKECGMNHFRHWREGLHEYLCTRSISD